MLLITYMHKEEFKMKVFVYSKKASKKIAEIKNVVSVACYSDKQEVLVLTGSGEILKFDGSEVKTTTYQN